MWICHVVVGAEFGFTVVSPVSQLRGVAVCNSAAPGLASDLTHRLPWKEKGAQSAAGVPGNVLSQEGRKCPAMRKERLEGFSRIIVGYAVVSEKNPASIVG